MNLTPAQALDELSKLDGIAEDHFQDSMGLPGWRYHDLPKLNASNFDKFVEIAGAENLRWITLAEYQRADGGSLRRGQVMMSPDAVRRCQEYAASLERGETS